MQNLFAVRFVMYGHASALVLSLGMVLTELSGLFLKFLDHSFSFSSYLHFLVGEYLIFFISHAILSSFHHGRQNHDHAALKVS